MRTIVRNGLDPACSGYYPSRRPVPNLLTDQGVSPIGRESVPPSAGRTRDKEFAMKRMTPPIAALILALLPSLSFADGRFRGGFGRGFGGYRSYGGYHSY